jgi:hypothetical protein
MHVPARDWSEGSMRPIQEFYEEYPRLVEYENDRNEVHGPDYYASTLDPTIPYAKSRPGPYFYIPQARHTYAYTHGTYAIQNEKQVSIAESTAGCIFWGIPMFAGGKAHFGAEILIDIALERCATARCAVELIGGFSVTYGLYSAGWEAGGTYASSAAGEVLLIADPHELW